MNAFENLESISNHKLIINNLSSNYSNSVFFSFEHEPDIEYFIEYTTIKVGKEIFKNCILLEKGDIAKYSKKRFQSIFNCLIESFSESNKNIIKKAMTHVSLKDLIKREKLKNIFYETKYVEDIIFEYFYSEEAHYIESFLFINDKFIPHLKIHLEDKSKSLIHDFIFIQKNNNLYMFNFESENFIEISDYIDIIFNIIGLNKLKECLNSEPFIFSELDVNKINLIELINY